MGLCQKISFPTKQAAKKEAQRIGADNKHFRYNNNKKNNMKIRVYECPICLEWHHTTLKPEKHMKKINRERLNKITELIEEK
jgi:hypothetical protein